MFWLIGWIVFGLIVGALARFLVPGPDPMGWIGTILLGVAGSVVGGVVVSLISGEGIGGAEPAGSIGATITSILLLLAARKYGRKQLS